MISSAALSPQNTSSTPTTQHSPVPLPLSSPSSRPRQPCPTLLNRMDRHRPPLAASPCRPGIPQALPAAPSPVSSPTGPPARLPFPHPYKQKWLPYALLSFIILVCAHTSADGQPCLQIAVPTRRWSHRGLPARHPQRWPSPPPRPPPTQLRTKPKRRSRFPSRHGRQRPNWSGRAPTQQTRLQTE